MSVDCVEGDGEVGEIGESEGFGCYIEEAQRWNGRDVELQTWKQDLRTLISQFHLKVLQGAMELAHDQIRSQCYEILDLTQDIVEEIVENFDWSVESYFLTTLHHSSTREFTLADPTRYQTEIAKCGHFWKRVGKGIEHGYKKGEKAIKKTCKAAKKGVKETGKAIAKVAEKTFDVVVGTGEVIADGGKAVGKAVGKGTKEVVHFVKEHKTETLVGLAIVAAVCGVYILTEEALRCAAAAKAAEMAAAATAAAAAAGKGSSRRREDESGRSEGNLSPLAITTPQPDNSWMKDDLRAKTPDIAFDQNLRPWEASTPFQTSFEAILGELQRTTTNNTSQFAAIAPFQNLPAFREAFGQGGNTLAQSGFADFLETVGKAALNIRPEMPAAGSDAFQRQNGLLESLGLRDAYTKFVETLGDGVDKVADSLPSPAEFLQTISGLAGLLFKSKEGESRLFETGENNPLTPQLGLINIESLFENGNGQLTEESVAQLRSALNPLTEILQKTSGLSGALFKPQEESSQLATEEFRLPKINTQPPLVNEITKVLNEVMNPIRSAWGGLVESLGQSVEKIGTNLPTSSKFLPDFSAPEGILAVSPPRHEPQESCYIETEGFKLPGVKIGVVNGMNTSFKEAMQHLEYLKKFADGMSIEGIYNHSNAPYFDLAEIFLLNYRGFAPVTRDLLINEWTRFHEENKNNPKAKYLHFAHSQGTILTEIALRDLPQEIRDRVIVVAIGPAVIIPEELCYRSFHYASKDDFVHCGENIPILGAFDSPHIPEQAKILEKFLENKKRLIILESDPNDKGMKHNFEHDIFVEVIQRHVKLHLINNGQYE